MALLTFPASPTNNQTYTVNGQTWTYDGKRWNPMNPVAGNGATGVIGVATTAPTGPGTGALWLNSDTGDISVYTGTGWVAIGSIAPISLATGYIQTNMLADLAVTTAKLSDNSVTTVKLVDANVTTAKIANYAITTGKIANYAVTAQQIANNTITASQLAANAVTSAKLASGTDYTPIALGNTAQRPGTAVNGYTRYNTDTYFMEMYYNSNWINTSVSIMAGQTQANPATSAAAIKAATGTTTDGFYWINLPVVGPTQVYCDMNTNGGGWMLVAKLYTDTTKFNGYSSTDWTTISTFNAGQGPTYAGHIKTDVYNYWLPTTGLRLCGGTLTNNLYEAWTGSSLYTLLNATSVNSQNSRAQWVTWGTTAAGIASTSFDNQPNCNQAGTNKSYSGYSARIGISMNNEADCASNDSCLGFGSNGGPCGYATVSPVTTGSMLGWIWVK